MYIYFIAFVIAMDKQKNEIHFIYKASKKANHFKEEKKRKATKLPVKLQIVRSLVDLWESN